MKSDTKIAVIRIRGQIGIDQDIKETLFRLKIRRKYSCVVLEPNQINLGMIKKVRSFVSYGEISKEIYEELLKKRGIKNSEGKLKPFFRLHPPRGGAETKLHYPKGILGENKEINKLIERML
ncbi:MAG: uL30 family ribosomal protein [Nanoarchaeota archaeon]|jgi:large subunit ribosomal protein L30|nr:uL30 family ribosomal protein [Nanoarchaeota archaeon]